MCAKWFISFGLFTARKNFMALLPFRSSMSQVISGSRNSGKTELIYKIIKHRDKLFDKYINKIYYFTVSGNQAFRGRKTIFHLYQGVTLWEFFNLNRLQNPWPDNNWLPTNASFRFSNNSRYLYKIFTPQKFKCSINITKFISPRKI